MKLMRYPNLILLAALWAVAGVQAENIPAVNEVLKLKSAGVAEDTIVAFVQGKNISYDLSTDSILRLRDQGVSSAVLNAMLISGKAAVNPLPLGTVPAMPQMPPPAAFPQPTAPPMVVSPTAVAPAVPPLTANPDAAYFYQELSPYGRWMLADDGQWCWQPTVVLNSPNWRPYWDKGHWMWTDQGWYWTSDYAWGCSCSSRRAKRRRESKASRFSRALARNLI